MPLIDVPTVHAVTDRRILADPGFRNRAEAVMNALGPAVAVHLRGAGLPDVLVFGLATSLVDAARETGSLIVVNGRPDIARGAGAPALQLSQSTLTPDDARRVARAFRIGMSIHSVGEARLALDSRAEWVIAGHVFETPAHAAAPPRGLEFVTAVAAVGIPVIAIGGIMPSRAGDVLAAGAHGIAAIRGIWDSPDPAAAAASYLQG
jgi:thiamine-phosphate diphosphorylase